MSRIIVGQGSGQQRLKRNTFLRHIHNSGFAPAQNKGQVVPLRQETLEIGLQRSNGHPIIFLVKGSYIVHYITSQIKTPYRAVNKTFSTVSM